MRNTLFALLILILGCHQKGDKKNAIQMERSPVITNTAPEKATGKFSVERTIRKCCELLEMSDAGYVSIDPSSVTWLKTNGPDHFNLYRFTLFNGAHYEYNNGHIVCLELVSLSDNNDIRILFPEHYAESSSDFYEPYLNSIVANKKDYCRNMSDISNYLIAYPDQKIKYRYLMEKDQLVVISTHTGHAYDILKKKKTSFIASDTVQFIFRKDTLKSFSKINRS